MISGHPVSLGDKEHIYLPGVDYLAMQVCETELRLQVENVFPALAVKTQ